MVERDGRKPVVLRERKAVEESLARSGQEHHVVIETGISSLEYTAALAEVASRVEQMREQGVDVRLTHRVVVRGALGEEEQVLDAGGVPYSLVNDNGEGGPQDG